MTYHSEHGQDRWLEENIFLGRRNGVFVELGALDGVAYSNTLFFETERDWSGVLIEANPMSFSYLLRSGSRPRSIKMLAAVGAAVGVGEFTAVHGVSGWSGMSHEMDGRHIERIEAQSPGTATFLATTFPLGDLLRTVGIRHVDYLCIDVEGAELSVIQPFNPSEFGVEILEVENNYGGTAVEIALREKGYRKFHSLEINDFYTSRIGQIGRFCAP